MFSSILTFAKAKPTLVLAAVVGLVLLGLYLALLRTEARLGKANQQLGAVKVLAAQQAATLKELTDLRTKDSLVVDGLVKDYKRLTQTDATFRDKIRTLESSNAQVRDYLSQPVPVQLGCLLDGTCTQASAP